MLELKNIVKDYPVGDETVHALKGVSMQFRKNEFVSILGQSGCGKTTLLNIIGGLDRYTEGDLIINGRSTKEFSDHDWDSYRNHSIGFVFQSYNLIPHQTVLQNVELALTLSGVSKTERRARAAKVLEQVGLGDQLNKKPNQMSGGQMQRVAIARALINDPDILLADEPTGALDTATSVQIMDILKEISKDKLIIMVTHNPELAEEYSSRIIRLLDGQVTDDSNPVSDEEQAEFAPVPEMSAAEKKALKKQLKKEHTSMSFFTALSLSLNNLMTKKGRTLLTSFAGSIGIIGIALILSLSHGVQTYIDRVQEETLSTYPLQIESITADTGSLLTSLMGIQDENAEPHTDGKIYSSNQLGEMLNTMMNSVKINDLESFKKFLDENQEVKDLVTDIKYSYSIEPNIFLPTTENGPSKINPSTLMNNMYAAMGVSDGSINEMSSFSSMGMGGGMNVWSEMINNEDLVHSQYDIVSGNWPKAYNEVVLIVNELNEMTDFAMYSLGLKDPSEIESIFKSLLMGQEVETEQVSYTYEELLNMTFRLVLPADYYAYNESTGVWDDKSLDKNYMTELINDDNRALTLKVVGIVRPNKDAVATSMRGAVAYDHTLTEYIINETNKREIVKQQLENKDKDVFTALPFEKDESEPTAEEIRAGFLKDIGEMSEEMQQRYLAQMGAMLTPTPGQEASAIDYTQYPELLEVVMRMQQGEQVSLSEVVAVLPDELIVQIYAATFQRDETRNTYEMNVAKLGIAKLERPSMINIYAKDFQSKDRLAEIIAEYNNSVDEEQQIEYTDFIKILMSSISTIINAIAYILTAFVAISLVVSSIMIGIITYISVLERTKEIGILRAIGASKRDIGRVFNAETFIIGLVAGLIGIGVTLLMDIPINIIIKHLTDISGLAKLPVIPSVILVMISVLLTLIAGLIPSKVAAKKDPVTALRTE